MHNLRYLLSLLALSAGLVPNVGFACVCDEVSLLESSEALTLRLREEEAMRALLRTVGPRAADGAEAVSLPVEYRASFDLGPLQPPSQPAWCVGGEGPNCEESSPLTQSQVEHVFPVTRSSLGALEANTSRREFLLPSVRTNADLLRAHDGQGTGIERPPR